MLTPPVGDLLLTMRERAEHVVTRRSSRSPQRCSTIRISRCAPMSTRWRAGPKVSPPTIIRFCRALGFAGLREFKLHLAQSLAVGTSTLHRAVAARRQHADRDAQGPAGRGERACQPRAAHRAGRSSSAPSRGSPRRGVSIATPSATRRCSWPATRRRASPGSASISNFYFDAHLQLVSAATMNKNDVVLAISHVGRMPFLLETVDVAKEQGATIIAMTQPGTPLAEMADIVLPVVVPADPLDARRHRGVSRATGVSRNTDGRHRLAPRPACTAPVETRARRCCRSAASTAKRIRCCERRGRTATCSRHELRTSTSSRARSCGRHGHRRHGRAALRRRCAHRRRSHRRDRRADLPTQDAEVHRRRRQDRRTGLHRRAHARRPDRAGGAADAAEDQSGRHHRRHRQLRHQPGAAGACRRAAAAQPAGRQGQVPLSDDGRVYRSGRTGSARGQRRRAGRPFDPARRDDGRSIPSRDARRASANGRAAARRHGCRRDRPELRCVLRDRCSRRRR